MNHIRSLGPVEYPTLDAIKHIDQGWCWFKSQTGKAKEEIPFWPQVLHCVLWCFSKSPKRVIRRGLWLLLAFDSIRDRLVGRLSTASSTCQYPCSSSRLSGLVIGLCWNLTDLTGGFRTLPRIFWPSNCLIPLLYVMGIRSR